MAALALPKGTDEERAARVRAVQAGLRQAVEVPLATMRIADGCWDALSEMARHGNLASRSDLEVGANTLEAGIWGAWRNVQTNLGEVEDAAFRESALAEGGRIAEAAPRRLAEILAELAKRG
jgi:glutamate formiminotransferase/formiminotetrahydrofolate cyclodeaminase